MPASFSISHQYHVLWIVLAVVLGVAAAYVAYRFTLPALPPSKRWLLIILRTLSLVLLIFLLFEPTLRMISTTIQPPTIAVLVDNSLSMTIRDRSGDRASKIRALIADHAIENLSVNTPISIYRFSSSVELIRPLSADSLHFDGESTDLSQMFTYLQQQIPKENIQSVVLISDGMYTTGKNPLYQSEALGIPLFTVGVGDTTEQKDILIEKVVSNDLVYSDTRTPVDVTVKSAGFDGERVEVTISDGSTVVDRKYLTLEKGTREFQVTLFVEPKEEGVKRYTVAVSHLQEELTDKNNSRPVFMKILKNKVNVLLLAGAPSADVAALRQVLAADNHYVVRSFTQNNGGTFYEGTLQPQVIDSADCFVFVGFPSSTSDARVEQLLYNQIERMKKPLFYLNGKSTDYKKLQTFEQLLPITWTSPSTTEMSVFPSINTRQKNHPLINIDGEVSPEDWAQLPPVYKVQTAFKAKPESDVLSTVKVEGVLLNEPFVVTRTVNRQKSLAVTAHGLWRWQLMTAGSPQTEHLLSSFISRAIKWLTTKDNDKNLRIEPTKLIFTTGEPVEFSAQAYDETLRPLEDAEIAVTLQHDKETYRLTLSSLGNGRYEGSLPNLPEGEYTYEGKAIKHGSAVGEDKGKLTVGHLNIEFLDTKLNKQLLEQLAFATNGSYHSIDEFSKLKKDLSDKTTFQEKEIVHAAELELWNWQYIAMTLIVLLGAEWFVRKRSGML